MTLHLTTEACTEAWDDLAQRLERFIATWEQGQEPTITEYLPAEPPAHRRIVLIELVKFDLERRASSVNSKGLEAYVAEFPELNENGEPPCDLIYEEYHIRRAAGQEVSPRDYYERFPRSAAALRRLMGTEQLTISTQLVGSRPVQAFAVGNRLDDFDLLVELGKGAFGSVFLARQISIQRLVALKISADKGTETQTLAKLEHPNIIGIYDQKRLTDRRLRLMYMQFAPGGTLADVVKQVRATPPAVRTGGILIVAVSTSLSKTGMLSGDEAAWKRRLAAATWPETVCRLGVQLAQALDHAHRQGVLHRDVKPANVLLAGDGSPKLADFNISFCSQLEGATPAAYFGGSTAYMSPEQLEACNPNHERKPEDLDGRSDLYSLAVLLWELLHGERPFADEEISGAWSRMLEAMAKTRRKEEPYSASPTRDPVALRLEQVLKKALSPEPANRHPDGAAMARELLLCLNPRAWDLVNDIKSGWRDWARRHPVLAMFPFNMTPILLASVFNYEFNYRMYIRQQSDVIQHGFDVMFYPINFTLFPLGVILISYYLWPMTRALRKLASGEPVSTEALRLARQRSLNAGHCIAAGGLILWLASGVSFPAGIAAYAHLHGEHFELYGWLHFLISMTVCGLISCCFPFLATTWLTVRVFFPALLADTTPEPNERRQLMDLSRQGGLYVAMAAVVPMLAALPLVSGRYNNPTFTTILIVGGVLGFGAAYYVYQRIRSDLAALSVVARPPDMIGTTTDTVESF